MKLRTRGCVMLGILIFFSANFYLLPTLLDKSPAEKPKTVRVATYNLWNLMFHWHIRLKGIASMILKHDLDVIGFQEVRTREQNSTWSNQLFQLRTALGADRYPHLFYLPASSVTGGEGIEEGIGIISKFPLMQMKTFRLPRLSTSADLNERVALRAVVRAPLMDIEVFVTHFSYEREAQCKNSAELAAFVQSLVPTDGLKTPQLILADFNVHNDSTWVIDELTKESLYEGHHCRVAAGSAGPWGDGPFIDTWRALNPNASEIDGYTFSNMPWPGMVSRPDRILFRNPKAGPRLTTIDVFSDGSGKSYKRWYYWEVVLSRGVLALSSPELAYLQRNLLLLALAPGLLLVTLIMRRYLVLKVVIWVVVAYLFFSLRPLLPAMFDPQQEDFNPSDHLLLMATFALDPA